MKPLFIIWVMLTVLSFTTGRAAAQAADDCSWSYAGSDRAAVKNRKVSQPTYTTANRGRPVTVEGWYDLVCPLGLQVPERSEISQTSPIPGLETIKVTLRGFLLAAKFERGEDHDVHAEIGSSPKWAGKHIIIEVPAFPRFCVARKALWKLVRADRLTQNLKPETSEWVFKDPPEVLITGFLFLDSHHLHADTKPKDICKDDGGRGSKDNGESQVQGLWEIHPAFTVSPVRARPRRRRNP